MMRRERRSQGFTLFEVLVAVSIMSICAVITIQVISLGLNNVSKSREYSKLVLTANNEMEKLLISEDITPGSKELERDGYIVRYEAVLLGDPDDGEETKEMAKAFDIYEINLTVTSNDPLFGRELDLSALKLVTRGGAVDVKKEG